MTTLPELLTYFRVLTNSFKFQVSAAITFGVALLLLWNGSNQQKIYLTILFLLPTCMLFGSIIEKIICWHQRKKQKQQKIMRNKLGLLRAYQYHAKHNELWPDKNHDGLAWQILLNMSPHKVFLTEPVCLKCKTNLITRTNMKCNGFYLECTDCKKQFNVDNIGEARSLAGASLQGEFRRKPGKFFS